MKAIKSISTVFAAGLVFGLWAETSLTFDPEAPNRQKQDYVLTDVSLPGDGDFTWEAWVKPSDVSLAENRILGQTDWQSEGRLILELRKSSGDTGNQTKLAVFYRVGGQNKRLVAATTVFAEDFWHHVALTRSGTALTLYVDGVEEGSSTDYAGPLPSVPFAFAQGFAGSLSEVRVWTTALTAESVAACRARRLGGTVADLAGAWPLGEGPGAPVNRTTGVAATIVGFVGGATPAEDTALDFSDGVPKPIALFRMSTIDGGVVPDSSGNGRALTLATGCSLTNDAPEGTGLYFDGTKAAWASFSHPALTDRTIAFWVKLTPEDGPIYDPAKTTFPYLFGAFGTTRMYYTTGTDNRISIGSGYFNKVETPFKTDNVNTFLRKGWNFITMTYAAADTSDDNVKNVTIKVYANGDLVTKYGSRYVAVDFGTKPVTNAFSAGTCILGNSNVNGKGDRPLKGVIDEVSVYDCALTAEQVLRLYAPRHTYETCSPLAGWDFDEITTSGSVRTVADVTGSGNDLTLQASLVATNGVYGGGLYWNGLPGNNAVTSQVIPPMSDWTFSAWIKVSTDLPADTSTYKLQRFYTFASDSFVQTSANATSLTVAAYPHSTGGSGGWTSFSSLPARNAWVHYALAYRSHMKADASGYEVTLDWYENGTKGGTLTALASGANKLKTSATKFLLGCNGTGAADGTRNFCGAMDSVRVYRGALDEKTVRQLYLAPAGAQAGTDFTTARAADVLRGGTDEKRTDTIASALGGKASWSVVSAPAGAGTDLIVSPDSLETAVSLPVLGTYVFRLTVATDSAATSDDVTVTRVAEAADNLTPTCTVPATDDCAIPSTLALAATANDPDSKPGALRVSWRRVSGPGPVEFAEADAASTTASFLTPGTYVLAVTADDGQATATAQMTVMVTKDSGSGLSEGLMHYWPLSAEAGQSVGKDLIGSRDLKLYNEVSSWETPGFTGYALRCNGANAQAYADAQAFPSGLTEFTASCWLFEDTNESYYATANVGRILTYNGALDIQHNKSATGANFCARLFYVDESGALKSAIWYFNKPQTSIANRWIHLAVVTDFSAAEDVRSVLKLYVDGVEMSLAADGCRMPETPKTVISSVTPWPGARQVDGRIDWGSARGAHRVFPGLIDEMRLYSRKLSAAEIRQLAFEMPTANRAPQTVVEAGASAKSPRRGTITLDPLLVDDGLPANGTLDGAWKVVSGDADAVTFKGNDATFSKAGTYGLAYVATDGERTTCSPTVTVEVSPLGTVLIVQ